MGYLKKYRGYTISLVTIHDNANYNNLAEFFGCSILNIVFDKDGLLYPMRFKYDAMVHKVDGEFVEYIPRQINEEPEQLELFEEGD